MIERIKKYLKYRSYMKHAKKELVKIAVITLPAVRKICNKSTDIINFIVKLTNETSKINSERLFEIILNEISNALQVNNCRIIDVLTYMAGLQPEDIQKILIHSIDKTMSDNAKK